MPKEQEKRERTWLESISIDYPYAYQFFTLADHPLNSSVRQQVEAWFKSEGYRIQVSVDSHRWTGAWYKLDDDALRIGGSEFYYGEGGDAEAFEFVATVVFKKLNEKYIPGGGYDTFLEDISTSAIKRDKMKKFWSSPKGAEMRRKSINKRKNG